MTAASVTTRPGESDDRAVTILQWVFYVLAGLVLLFGVYMGIGLIGFAGNMSSFMPMIQMMSAPAIANLLSGMLLRIATSLGIGVILLSLLISALLFTAGKLLGRTHDLARRVQRLEQEAARRA